MGRVAGRADADLGDGPFSLPEGGPRDWAELPLPEGAIVVGLDGGYVRGRDQPGQAGHFEVLVGRSMPEEHSASQTTSCCQTTSLTREESVGIYANMKAELVRRSKSVLRDGAIVEMVIWKLPQSVLGSNHSYKYRLYFGRGGKRIVGFDNERGEGDHRHLEGKEEPYVFTTVEALVRDFLDEIHRRMAK